MQLYLKPQNPIILPLNYLNTQLIIKINLYNCKLSLEK